MRDGEQKQMAGALSRGAVVQKVLEALLKGWRLMAQKVAVAEMPGFCAGALLGEGREKKVEGAI